MERFCLDIRMMLEEKAQTYGERGGFYENNGPETGYGHAVGEAKLKLTEYAMKHALRLLVKAAAWIFLVYESEMMHIWETQSTKAKSSGA